MMSNGIEHPPTVDRVFAFHGWTYGALLLYSAALLAFYALVIVQVFRLAGDPVSASARSQLPPVAVGAIDRHALSSAPTGCGLVSD